MKQRITAMATFLILLVAGGAHASLTIIGSASYNGEQYNLIWDDDNNGKSVVWLDYTSLYNPATGTNYNDQMQWASNLNTEITNITISQGYNVQWQSGWRLPDTKLGVSSWNYDQYNPDFYNGSGVNSTGFNIATSELGHLYYTELQNPGQITQSGQIQITGQTSFVLNTGDFDNLTVLGAYWSATQADQYQGNNTAYIFQMYGGYQSLGFSDYYQNNAIALREANVTITSPVPIPSALLLLGSALTGLTAATRRKRQ